jgi:hypothetical protein
MDFLPNIPAGADLGCVPKRDLIACQRRLNPTPWTALTEDKKLFYAYCAAMKLPVPTMWAVFDTPDGWLSTGEIISERNDWQRVFNEDLPDEFVIKPAGGVYGLGVSVFKRTPSGFEDFNGDTTTASDLYETLRSDGSFQSFVIQERIYNHYDLIRFSGTRALQTARLVTWLRSDGEVIDAVNGTLGSALGPGQEGFGFRVVAEHPTTGATIDGFQLPYWREARELVCRAARLFRPLRTIGWDVALTSSGPVLIEDNVWWDPSNDLVIGPQASDSRRGGLITLLKHLKQGHREGH